MGGDIGVKNNIHGAILALQEFPIKILLTGNKDLIQKELENYSDVDQSRLIIEHCEESISMEDSPTKAYRQKKNSSIHIGLKHVKENKAQAFVSAGNTGAILTASTMILGRSKGVDRPALTSAIPGDKGPFVLVDLGSNVDCKSSHLKQFAIMGHYFAKYILHIEKPKIGLLNIGEEKEKGNNLTLETYPLLKDLPYDFIGNIEANHILFNKADVVVCDGFVGNNILKFAESFSKLLSSFFRGASKNSFMAKIGLLFLNCELKKLKKKFSYDTYGGAQLLGINGVSIIAHGSAKGLAIKNAIRVAIESVESQMVEQIAKNIVKYHKDSEKK